MGSAPLILGRSVSLPQLGELSGARDQMERLLWVVVGLASDLEVNATLHRIVTAAMELTGAGYGAVGVLGADGHLMSSSPKRIGADRYGI